jgi:hypothetical protein
MSVRIRILSLADGSESPFDGQFVAKWDWKRHARGTHGERLAVHVVTTPYANAAREFDTRDEALAVWEQALTGFAVEITGWKH